MAGKVVIVARYTVKPGQMAGVEAALVRMAAEVKAHEPGCLAWEANRSTEQPNQLLLYEVYAGQEALDAHRQTPHFRRFIEGAVAPLLDKRQRELYEPLEG